MSRKIRARLKKSYAPVMSAFNHAERREASNHLKVNGPHRIDPARTVFKPSNPAALVSMAVNHYAAPRSRKILKMVKMRGKLVLGMEATLPPEPFHWEMASRHIQRNRATGKKHPLDKKVAA